MTKTHVRPATCKYLNRAGNHCQLHQKDGTPYCRKHQKMVAEGKVWRTKVLEVAS
jgi:hypothetical protein